jgi:hypothetical protein
MEGVKRIASADAAAPAGEVQGSAPTPPRAVVGGVIGTLDPPDALILGDHHGGHVWPAAPERFRCARRARTALLIAPTDAHRGTPSHTADEPASQTNYVWTSSRGQWA